MLFFFVADVSLIELGASIRAEQLFCIYTILEPRVKIWYQYNRFNPYHNPPFPVAYITCRSEAEVLVLVVLRMALWLFAAAFVSCFVVFFMFFFFFCFVVFCLFFVALLCSVDPVYHCYQLVLEEAAGCFAFHWSMSCVLSVMVSFPLSLGVIGRL